MNRMITQVFVIALGICLFGNYAYGQELEAFEVKEEAIGALQGKIRVTGLKAKHRYQLTINGYKNHPSNEILMKNYSTYNAEGYYDFKKVFSDANGVIEVSFNQKLPKGAYRVKFLIKDIRNNWLTVFSENEVQFEVQ
ncbi:MAG: hypothetical protein JRJ38_07125 [Deltaproteobacteria bacterium]|nr:hypothetical protein [Deltaproteobacteria bacterium]